MDYVENGLKIGTREAGNSSLSKRAISRQTLPDELATRLRDMIIGGELRPGCRLNTLRLCSRFGVSRTPLREALKVLATEGLILLKPNRSAVVERVTSEMIDELIPILGMLEALAGRIACGRIDAAVLANVEALHERLLHHFERREAKSYMETESAILRIVFTVAANETLTRLYEILMMKLQWQSARQHAAPEWEQSVEVQKHFLHALKVRDGDLWTLVAQRHVLLRAALLPGAASPIVTAKPRLQRSGK